MELYLNWTTISLKIKTCKAALIGGVYILCIIWVPLYKYVVLGLLEEAGQYTIALVFCSLNMNVNIADSCLTTSCMRWFCCCTWFLVALVICISIYKMSHIMLFVSVMMPTWFVKKGNTYYFLNEHIYNILHVLNVNFCQGSMQIVEDE